MATVTSPSHDIAVVNLGLTDYESAWKIQRAAFQLRQSGRIGDTLLFVEHPPVYTFGRNSDENHLLLNEEELRHSGAEVFHVERGGDITFHGPGQIVGYPIFDLRNYYEDLHRYLRDLEESILRTLRRYEIAGGRDDQFTGVWVGGEKIAAIGVKVARWVTMHGFALNVSTDLSFFDRIIPCGIFHKGVTSMERILRRVIDTHEVRLLLAEEFADVFGGSATKMTREFFLQLLDSIPDEHHAWQIAEIQTLPR